MRPAVVVFAVAVVAQWLVPLLGVWRQERVIARGVPVRIRCTAPDPYDPLRGRYLAIRPEETEAPAPVLPPRRTVPVWATLIVGADGLARIGSLSLEPVRGPTVIRLVARQAWESDGRESTRAVVDWPFDRFYLSERLAPAADELVADRLREGEQPVAEFRLLDGRGVLTDLLLDGVSIRDLVTQQAK
jgi:hypothetical protein